MLISIKYFTHNIQTQIDKYRKWKGTIAELEKLKTFFIISSGDLTIYFTMGSSRWRNFTEFNFAADYFDLTSQFQFILGGTRT